MFVILVLGYAPAHFNIHDLEKPQELHASPRKFFI